MPAPSLLYARLRADPSGTLDAIAAALIAAGSIDGAAPALGVGARTFDRLIATTPALRDRVALLRKAGKIGPSRGPNAR